MICFSVVKNNCPSRIIGLARLLLNNEGKIKAFSVMQNLRTFAIHTQ